MIRSLKFLVVLIVGGIMALDDRTVKFMATTTLLIMVVFSTWLLFDSHMIIGYARESTMLTDYKVLLEITRLDGIRNKIILSDPRGIFPESSTGWIWLFARGESRTLSGTSYFFIDWYRAQPIPTVSFPLSRRSSLTWLAEHRSLVVLLAASMVVLAGYWLRIIAAAFFAIVSGAVVWHILQLVSLWHDTSIGLSVYPLLLYTCVGFFVIGLRIRSGAFFWVTQRATAVVVLWLVYPLIFQTEWASLSPYMLEFAMLLALIMPTTVFALTAASLLIIGQLLNQTQEIVILIGCLSASLMRLVRLPAASRLTQDKVVCSTATLQ